MSKSYLMSCVFHLALFTAALMVAVPLIEKPEEPIVIELIEPAPAPEMKASAVAIEAAAPQVKPVDEVAPAKPAQAQVKEEAPITEEIKIPAKKAQAPKVVKTVKMTAPKVVARATVPETLDDIEASDLDYDAVQVSPQAALNDQDLDGEFSKIDKKTEAQLKAEQASIDQETQSAEQETNEALAGLENENKERAKAMSDALQATRTKNAAVLAQMRAGEEAQARREAEIAAANAARAKAAAARAAQMKGEGSGSSKLASGNGSQVRSVENLRQRPGNPKPQYDMEERLRKETGTVIFHAFVTSEGALEKFKLVQSTGHRNLDGKTLAALRKWKFYPGQQGWVEIPQTWNLKGEAEEMPATLRRKVSQR